MADIGERHTLVSLFSGSMGMDLGFQATGRFRLLACVERDAACRRAIRANRAAGRLGTEPFRLYGEDVAGLDPRRVMRDLGLRPGELACLAGGPPCQSMSLAGRRGGAEDERGLMLWQYLWFVEEFRPAAFVLENVRGMLSASLRRAGRRGPASEEERPGSLLHRFLADLPCEYRVDVFVVNAANHGCPQARERVVMVGNRCGRLAGFPRPTHGPGRAPYRTLRDALEGLDDPDPVVLDFTRRRKRFLARVPPGGNWRDLPPEVAREAMGRSYRGAGGRSGFYRRLAWKQPCPAVTTAPNQAMTCMCHPVITRALTLRECAAIQEFPSGWTFAGSVAERYRQVGNAVPVGLARVAGEAAADLLDAIRDGGSEDGGHPRRRVVRVGPVVRFPRYLGAKAGR